MNKLKPCPFCGGEADIEEIPGSPFTNEPYTWGVGCKTCNIGWYEEAKERAIDVWNRRPDMWIPVSERLPESGLHVLLSCEVRPGSIRRYVCDGYYAASKTIICRGEDECANEYDEDKDEYFLLEGWYEVIKNWDDFSSIAIGDFVTHWMPLPLPPEGGAE